ncbi:MAG: hypothetical protein ACI8PZ_006709, partial [Myxococcota bacterium]
MLSRTSPTPAVGRVAAGLVIAAALGSCCWLGDRRPEPVSAGAQAISLLDLPAATLSVPPDCRPDGAEPPERIPLDGPWRNDGETSKGMYKFTMDVPIRPRGLFFHRPQPGIEMRGPDGASVPYHRYIKSSTPFWWHDTDELYVLFPDDREAPRPGEFTLS